MTAKKTEPNPDELVTIKVRRAIRDLVKTTKKDKYMPIGIFFEEAANEKLKREKK